MSNLQIKSFATRDEQEVAGYAEVMELVFSSWQDIALTENHIKQLHRDLLTYSEKDTWHRGSYKTSTNSVVAFDEDGKQLGVVFATATPFDTPRLMTELVTWFNDERACREASPLAADRHLGRGVPRDPSIPGRQRPAKPRSDHTAAAAGRLCLRALQLAGKRDRAEQGGLLPRLAANARARFAATRRTGNRGWSSSCARWQSKFAASAARSSAKNSYWPHYPNCRCKSWSSPASTGASPWAKRSA